MTPVFVDSYNSLGKGKFHLKTKKSPLRIFKKNTMVLAVEILKHPFFKKKPNNFYARNCDINVGFQLFSIFCVKRLNTTVQICYHY